MPELEWVLGYPFALGLMAAVAGGILLWFRHKGWIGRRARAHNDDSGHAKKAVKAPRPDGPKPAAPRLPLRSAAERADEAAESGSDHPPAA